MKAKKMALFIAVIFMAVPLAVLAAGYDSGQPDTNTFTMSNYGYVMTTSSDGIGSVTVYEGTYSGTGTVRDDITDWGYSNGIGPFNTFYAAVNLYNTSEYSGEARISTEPGKIAYVLNPSDLKKTLDGTTYSGTYNIMLVIPAVYWFVDGNTVYMSNQKGFFTGIDGMYAYAHTVKNGSEETEYPFLALGVYESSVRNISNSNVLVSVSGVSPFYSNPITDFREYAYNNSPSDGSQYGLWNFYQWTLYKMMSYTVMSSTDSKTTVGNGVIRQQQMSVKDTGETDRNGWYYGTKADYRTSSKLFIENSWGNIWEFVDNAAMDSNGSFHAGSSLVTSVNDTNGVSGDEYFQDVSLIDTNNRHSRMYVTSADTPSWDLPTGSGATNNPSGDSVRTSIGNDNRAVMVGGSVKTSSEGGRAGLSTFGSYLGFAETGIGARLAYLMTDSSSFVHRIIYNGDVGFHVAGPAFSMEGRQIELQIDDGYRFNALSYSYTDDSFSYQYDIKETRRFNMPGYEVTVDYVVEEKVDVTVERYLTNGEIIADPDVYLFSVGKDSGYTTSGKRMTITDTNGDVYILEAAPASGWYFYGFVDDNGNLMRNGRFIADTEISASFTGEVFFYYVEFHEPNDVVTVFVVENGLAIQLPAPTPIPGKDFKGWYYDEGFTQLVGVQNSIYIPSGDDEVIKMHACFVDHIGPTPDWLTVSCEFSLDGSTPGAASAVFDAVYPQYVMGGSVDPLIIKLKEGASGTFVHTVTAVNATVTRVSNDAWLFSDATDNVTLSVSSVTVTEQGCDSICIMKTLDDTGVRVVITPTTQAGLPEGRVTIKGIAYDTSGGMISYSNVSIQLQPVTSGMQIYDVSAGGITGPNEYLYTVYAVFEYGYDEVTGTYSHSCISEAVSVPGGGA